MENSELERIADEKRARALYLKIDEKAGEIVNSLGKEKNRSSSNSLQDYFEEHFAPSIFGSRLRLKDNSTYVRENSWHKANGISIFVEDYWCSKKNNGKYENRNVDIYFDLRKKILNILPMKIRTLVYSHEVMLTTITKERGEKETQGFHILGCFREEGKWLETLEMLYKKALSTGVEKGLDKIEKEAAERNKLLKEGFGIQ